VSEFKTAQLRLVYSLLKPAVAMAARFHVPMRTLAELLRLAYFEVLRREGLSQAAVGERLGQTARHMRTLESRLKGDFFTAEAEVGLVREVESEVARSSPTAKQLAAALPGWSEDDVERAVTTLVEEGRVVRDKTRLKIAQRYLVLGSDKFHHRVDALNHFLGGVTQAVLQRLLFDERDEAMVKTISFVARPARLQEFLRTLEANLRREIAALEEDASFEGEGQRYVLGVFSGKER
jgi:ParB-like chromosome segregation protein Spo0J